MVKTDSLRLMLYRLAVDDGRLEIIDNGSVNCVTLWEEARSGQQSWTETLIASSGVRAEGPTHEIFDGTPVGT